MNHILLGTGRQVRLRCAGCGACVAPPFNTIRDEHDDELIGFLCAPCFKRTDDDGVFAWIVDGAARDSKTVPEVTAAFAAYGLAIPTTDAARHAAMARISGCEGRA